MKTYTCEYCSYELATNNFREFAMHKSHCKKNPNVIKGYEKSSKKRTLPRHIYKFNCKKCNKEYELKLTENDYKKGKYKKYCSRNCANSRVWLEEDKRKKSYASKNSKKVLEANRKKRNNQIEKLCPICKKKYFVPVCHKKRIYCSRECYLKDINHQYRKVGLGGYRINSGRSKGGFYKGIYCHSSYELAWVIYNIDHNIPFKQNTKKFDYINLKNKKSKYIPDFILIEDNTYIEIKGYWNKTIDLKLKYFPHKIKILYKDDLKEIFDYVENKYGKDFIKLYEGNPHNKRKNKCKICGKPAINIYCSRKCSMNGNNKYKMRQ